MGEVCVNTGGQPLRFAVNGSIPDFEIGIEKISNWRVGHIEDRHLDLLDIAGAVFATDGMIRRGATQRPRLGEGWRRQLDFDIEVRQPKFWRSAVVCDALVETVSFLTEDMVSFRFSQGTNSAPKQRYFDYEDLRSAQATADHFVLFSGGLDSLAGALETLAHQTGRVVLVTHRSSQKILGRQDALAAELKRRHPDRVAYVPISATRRGERSLEMTQRSRSFLYAAFGFTMARACGAKSLSFFENGVVSHNLPISPQIVGAMATRTTHPRALMLFEQLLSLIDEKPFTVSNPFAWYTKTEVLQKVRSHGATALIATSVSCNHVWGRTSDKPHCGCCSQCIDRRFGILAANLAAHEKDETYDTPILVGARNAVKSKVMALEWTRHALRLADMSPADFKQRFGGELARIAQGFPRIGQSEVVQRAHDLHRRHGEAIRAALASAISAHASELMARTLPDTALLRLVAAEVAMPTGLPTVDAGVLTATLEADAGFDAEDGVDAPDAGRLVARLLREDGVTKVEVDGLGVVVGAAATPVFAQYHHWRADHDAGCERRLHRLHPAKTLTPVAGVSASAVTQNIKRCRDQLAEFYAGIHGEPPQAPLLIHGIEHRRGYRLDPWATITDADPARR